MHTFVSVPDTATFNVVYQFSVGGHSVERVIFKKVNLTDAMRLVNTLNGGKGAEVSFVARYLPKGGV